jgi:hypothetical protein
MLCFEIEVNGETRFVVGHPEANVLSLIASFVRVRKELELSGGAMVTHSNDETEHLSWEPHQLRLGDEVVLRVVESEAGSEPKRSVRQSLADSERSERNYYEHMKQKYEPK